MKPIRIGITGSNGFLGFHLAAYLHGENERAIALPCSRETLLNADKLAVFAADCDAIVHFAGLNRGLESDIFDTNVELARNWIRALERTESRPHFIFASSPHEERDTAYGRSKKEARNLMAEWGARNRLPFSGLIIPNSFGPFGKPDYNSFVATFCHRIANGGEPTVQKDDTVPLLYAGNLATRILTLILSGTTGEKILIPADLSVSVGEVRELLKRFYRDYVLKCRIPHTSSAYETDLFNTFRSYLPKDYFPVRLDKKSDARGFLVEVAKSESKGGQVFFSETNPGITRGNHYHRRKIERFCVINGEAVIRIRKMFQSDAVEFNVNGQQPSFVDMPVLSTHNITNIGSGPLHTMFWTNEIFDPENPDTFFEVV